MKTLLRLLALTALCVSLSSCLFKEPIFTSGFQKLDSSLSGVWMTEDQDGDPRDRDYAVLAPVGDAFVLHYPVSRKGSGYFDARPLDVNGKQLLQVRQVMSFDDGIPASDTPTYTILWVEKISDGKVSIRALSPEGPHTASPAAAKKAIEDKSSDWTKLFGDAQVFTRLRDK